MNRENRWSSRSCNDAGGTAAGTNRWNSKNNNLFSSFFQKFRAKNRILLEDVTSLPSSPHSCSRRSLRTDCARWDSAQSLLSSATSASFAFIPTGRTFSPTGQQRVDSYQLDSVDPTCRKDAINGTFLRRKYNLLGSDSTLHQVEDISRKGSKNPHRNSIGAVENLFRNSEFSNQNLSNDGSRSTSRIRRCHKPGKRKAPQPPVVRPNAQWSEIGRRPGWNGSCKKKRKAPSPPMDWSNDSLRLERGVLKSNKNSVLTRKNQSARSKLEAEVPTSPRPWYKRTSSASTSFSSSSTSIFKSLQKRNSCEQMLNECMLESGMPRAPLCLSSVQPESGKRKSQISMLANISELDREATEILRRERVRMQEFTEAVDGKFYSSSSTSSPATDAIQVIYDSKVPAQRKKTSTKDLVSNDSELTGIINKVAEIHSVPVVPQSEKFSAPSVKEKWCKTKIVEISKNEKAAPSSSTCAARTEETPNSRKFEEKSLVTNKVNGSSKPIKPFSNWTCPQCTLENPSWKFICEACNKWRPYSVSTSISSSPVNPKEDTELRRGHEITKSQSSGSIMTSTNKGINEFRQIVQNMEQMRRARLEFFDKRRGDDKINQGNDIKLQDTGTENYKHYTNDEREKLREILTDLRKLSNNESNCLITAVPHSDDKEKDEHVEAYLVKIKTIVEDIVAPRQSVDFCEDNISSKKDLEPDQGVTRLENDVIGIPVEEYVTQNSVVENVKKDEIETRLINSSELARLQQFSSKTGKMSEFSKEMDRLSKQLSQLKQLSAKRQGAVSKVNKNSTPLTVNRLLNKLQTAIASGQHHEAANIARELARLKVNCSMTRQQSPVLELNSTVNIKMYVEDKKSHRGPFPVKINPKITIGELKEQIFQQLEIPTNVQRWILGKTLAINDAQTLEQMGLKTDGASIILYLSSTENTNQIGNLKILQDLAVRIKRQHEENVVERKEENSVPTKLGRLKTKANEEKNEAETRKIANTQKLHIETSDGNLQFQTGLESSSSCHVAFEDKSNGIIPITVANEGEQQTERETQRIPNYQQLVELDKENLVQNSDEFECPICFCGYAPGDGVVLKDCLHTFCRDCLSETIKYSTDAEVKCPYSDATYSCDSLLQDREIKMLVSEQIYKRHLDRSISEAEKKIEKAFHCKTANCQGWCIFEDDVNQFLCPVCNQTNCLTCQAIHTGLNCIQYQRILEETSETNIDAKKTKDLLVEMLEKGEAMTCPTCQVILMKKSGCDWLSCTMCKTEICWVTRGPRWGPGGKGDTSKGCKCGVGGRKCHPKCNYCH